MTIILAIRAMLGVTPAQVQDPRLCSIASRPPFSSQFDCSGYYGARVVTIEGLSAWRYMALWARDNAGRFLDPGQRINAAFASRLWRFNGSGVELRVRNGEFSIRHDIPEKDYVEVELLRVGTNASEAVKIPWLAGTLSSNLKLFQSSATFEQAFWSGLASAASSGLSPVGEGASEDPAVSVGALENAQGGSWEMFPPTALLRRQPSYAHATLISGPNDLWPVLKLADGKTGVVALPTFGALDPDFTNSTFLFLRQSLKAFDTVNSNNCSRVIIDLRGNMGGAVIFAPLLAQLIAGSQEFSGKPRVMDTLRYLADTALVRALANESLGLFSWRLFANATTEQDFTNSTKGSFFYKIQRLPDVEGLYSNVFKVRTPKLEDFQSVVGRSVADPALGAKPLMLLSDGLCYGACGTFATEMRRRFRVPLVTIGGLPHRSLAFQGGGGGFTSAAQALLRSWSGTNLSRRGDLEAPTAFQGPITMNIRCAMGFYDLNDSVPMAYAFLGGDHKLLYNRGNIADDSLVYVEAAQFFS